MQKFTQKVLFGAQKNRPVEFYPIDLNDTENLSLLSHSPLFHGLDNSLHGKGLQHKLPYYLEPMMVMGRAYDLLPVYKKASLMLDHHLVQRTKGSQSILYNLFREQEYTRELDYKSTSSHKWYRTYQVVKAVFNVNINWKDSSQDTLRHRLEDELGIGLDYGNSIFRKYSSNIYFLFGMEIVLECIFSVLQNFLGMAKLDVS